jgi:Domain of unknown function (DUF4870)
VGRTRLSPAAVVCGGTLFATGAVCGYLAAVVGHLILRPQDCTVAACTGLDEVAWPIGVAGGLVGGASYTALGLAAGLPGRRWAPGEISGELTDVPGGVERAAAALAQLTIFAGVPIVGPGALALIAWRTAPFLRRHAVAAVRLQLWQILLIAPVAFLFFLTLGLYTIVALTALFGGLVYAIIGAVRAANGKLPAYPGNWPPSPGPTTATESVPRPSRERRARLALIVLVVGISANFLRVALTSTH